MTDEEIMALAKQTKKEKFCKQYFLPWNCWQCSFNRDGIECSEEYELGFIDGYKAAFDTLIGKISDMTLCDQIKNIDKP